MEDPAEPSARPDGPTPPPDTPAEGRPGRAGEFIDPQRLLRIAGVTREVLEEARRIRPEAGAVDHLRRVHGQIVDELRGSLPDGLYQELDQLTPEIRDGTLEELALAHAEILGWLEGLFQGTHLALQMQAMQTRGPRGQPRLAPGTPPAESDRPDSRYL